MECLTGNRVSSLWGRLFIVWLLTLFKYNVLGTGNLLLTESDHLQVLNLFKLIALSHHNRPPPPPQRPATLPLTYLPAEPVVMVEAGPPIRLQPFDQA